MLEKFKVTPTITTLHAIEYKEDVVTLMVTTYADVATDADTFGCCKS